MSVFFHRFDVRTACVPFVLYLIYLPHITGLSSTESINKLVNMSNSYLTTMYESIFAQQYIFLVETLYLPFLLSWKMHLPALSAPVRHNY